MAQIRYCIKPTIKIIAKVSLFVFYSEGLKYQFFVEVTKEVIHMLLLQVRNEDR